MKDTGKIIKLLEEFFFTYGKNFEINFLDLAKFDSNIANALLDNPKDILKCFNIAYLNKFDSKIELKFINLPNSEFLNVNNIRCEYLQKFKKIKGIISSRTGIKAKVIKAKFECPSCGNVMNVLQRTEKFTEPSKCGCGRKGKFQLLNKELIDFLELYLSDLPENLKTNETSNKLKIVLCNSLTKNDGLLYPGRRIEIIGILNEVPTKVDRAQSVVFSFLFEGNNYQILDQIEFDSKLSKQEEELFEEIQSQKNPAKFISNLLFNDICGNDIVKEALIIQQFGNQKTPDGKRDFIHVLLVGDPGTAKTDLMTRIPALNPIHNYATATDTTKVGLTACVKKSESGVWSAEAGLLTLTNGGVVGIDEIDKAKDDDINGLHTAMESGFVHLNKAGINLKLPTNTGIVATANNKVGSNLKKVDEKSIKVARTIIDRFDLIYTFKDLVGENDEKIATSIVSRYTFDNSKTTFDDFKTTFNNNSNTFLYNNKEYKLSTIQKYIFLMKNNKTQYPKLSKRLCTQIVEWYRVVRNASHIDDYEGKKPTPRIIESLIRVSRAIARMKGLDTVRIHELKLAMRYFPTINGIHFTETKEVKI